jgi:hypothetical protein
MAPGNQAGGSAKPRLSQSSRRDPSARQGNLMKEIDTETRALLKSKFSFGALPAETVD